MLLDRAAQPVMCRQPPGKRLLHLAVAMICLLNGPKPAPKRRSLGLSDHIFIDCADDEMRHDVGDLASTFPVTIAQQLSIIGDWVEEPDQPRRRDRVEQPIVDARCVDTPLRSAWQWATSHPDLGKQGRNQQAVRHVSIDVLDQLAREARRIVTALIGQDRDGPSPPIAVAVRQQGVRRVVALPIEAFSRTHDRLKRVG
jgi:hypothetical protein